MEKDPGTPIKIPGSDLLAPWQDSNPRGVPRYADAIAAESNYFFNSPFAHFSRGFGLGLYQWEASTQT